ncbi:MAG TPA: GTPase, partial [Acidobacteriaceae bacterium]|nr:GTPase [Acidobacteriaceae bacterium]
GTTRDLVTERLSLGGIPVELVDTAGLREASEEAEVLGIRKSREALAEADVVLMVLDASVPLRDDEATLLASLAGRRVIAVMNKCDLNLNGGAGLLLESPLTVQAVATSALTGDGIADLREALASLVRNPRGESESGMLTSIRHFEAVTGALEALRAAKAAVPAKTPHEMLLLDLYSGLRHLDSLTGETTADDILNRIFSSFCIGK